MHMVRVVFIQESLSGVDQVGWHRQKEVLPLQERFARNYSLFNPNIFHRNVHYLVFVRMGTKQSFWTTAGLQPRRQICPFLYQRRRDRNLAACFLLWRHCLCRVFSVIRVRHGHRLSQDEAFWGAMFECIVWKGRRQWKQVTLQISLHTPRGVRCPDWLTSLTFLTWSVRLAIYGVTTLELIVCGTSTAGKACSRVMLLGSAQSTNRRVWRKRLGIWSNCGTDFDSAMCCRDSGDYL